MNICDTLSLPDTSPIWFGYITFDTLNQVTVTYCKLSVIYLFLLFGFGAIALFIWLWKIISQRRKISINPMNVCLHLKHISANTLVDYVTVSQKWRVFFYVLGIFAILFGLPAINLGQLVFKALFSSESHPWLTIVIEVIALFAIILVEFGFLIILIFLLNTIGSQVEMLLLSSSPIQMNSLSRQEREVLIRFNLKRTAMFFSLFIVILVVICIVSLLEQIDSHDMVEFLTLTGNFYQLAWGYLLVSKLPFLFQENLLLRRSTKYLRIQNKMIALYKFFEDYGPKKVISNFQEEESLYSQDISLLRLCQIQLEALEHRVQLLEDDKSVPLPRNTIGKILLVPKIFLALNCAILIGKATSFLGFMGSWSSEAIVWGYFVSAAVGIFGIPLLSMIIFHSKILLGEENVEVFDDNERESDISQCSQNSNDNGISIVLLRSSLN